MRSAWWHSCQSQFVCPGTHMLPSSTSCRGNICKAESVLRTSPGAWACADLVELHARGRSCCQVLGHTAVERHSNNRPKQLKCCISCSPCQLQVLTSSHGPARQVASSKYGNTPSQWVALGAEPCWVAIRDTNLERAKLCSLPPSEREGAPGSQGERRRAHGMGEGRE